MSMLIDTGILSEPDRKAFWRDEVCAPFMYSAPVYQNDEAFCGTHEIRLLGSTTFLETRSTRYGAVRGSAEIRQTPDEFAVLMRQRAGTRWIAQFDRRVTMTAGDLILVDSTAPMATGMDDPGALECIVMPRSVLARRVDNLDRTLARTLKAESRAGTLLNAYCDMVIAQSETVDPQHQPWLEGTFHDLVAMAFGGDPARMENGVATLQSARLQNLVSHIERNFGDLHLSPETVAVRFGISQRYVHKLFEASPMSFRQTLVQRRLTAARQALLDPRQAHRSIADIAFSCGFGDLSGFNRSFKATYGATPRGMRAGMLMHAEPHLPAARRQ